jgi:hypothetical protein
MRKTAALVGSVGLMMVGFAAPAQAHEREAPPLHGHVLVLGVQWENGEPVGFRKCVDLAGGNWLKKNNHHYTVHTGRAGEALFNAGHIVAPTAPLWPEVRNCADLEAMFGQ